MERNSDQFDDQTIDTNSLILVTTGWCPFTANAKSFWNDAANNVGMPLKVVNLDEAEGEQIARAAGVQGVPYLETSFEGIVASSTLANIGVGLSVPWYCVLK